MSWYDDGDTSHFRVIFRMRRYERRDLLFGMLSRFTPIILTR